jgi:hypothetical protein
VEGLAGPLKSAALLDRGLKSKVENFRKSLLERMQYKVTSRTLQSIHQLSAIFLFPSHACCYTSASAHSFVISNSESPIKRELVAK